MIDKDRFKNLLQTMREHELDYFMISPSDNLRSLLGFSPGKCERFQALFIQADGRYFYISPQIYYEEISEVMPPENIYMWKDREGYLDLMEQVMSQYDFKGAKIAVDNSVDAVDIINLAELADITFYDGHAYLEDLRIIKSPEEIDALQGAAALADQVMARTIAYIKPGLTEYEIKKKVEEEALKLTAEGLSFEPIIASGPNSSKPHYNKISRTIQEKDIVLLDLGVVYQGYCSDISRTVFVGAASAQEQEIYALVKEANQAAVDALGPGVTAAELDRTAREVITAAGYGDYFLNRLGHGIGISVHEAPYITGTNSRELQPGMAFSIEPGIYLAGKFGIRIEDIAVVTKTGKKILNRSSRDLIVK